MNEERQNVVEFIERQAASWDEYSHFESTIAGDLKRAERDAYFAAKLRLLAHSIRIGEHDKCMMI